MEILPNEQVMPPTYKDVVFAKAILDSGGKMELKMNIYRPKNADKPTPVLVYIFGGAWINGDYTQLNSRPMNWQLPLTLVEQGITFVSVDYRRSTEAIFPAQIHDIKGAIRFLRAHADEYGIKKDRIGVWGISSGGHLSALTAATGDNPDLEGNVGGNLEESSRVTAAVAVYPAVDILRMSQDMEPHVLAPEVAIADHDSMDSPEAVLFGFSGPGKGMAVLRKIYDRKQTDSPYWEKATLVEMSNPITWITKDCAPMLVLNGALDDKAAWIQSVKLFKALSRAGVPALYLTDSKMSHDHTTGSMELFDTALQYMKHKLFAE